MDASLPREVWRVACVLHEVGPLQILVEIACELPHRLPEDAEAVPRHRLVGFDVLAVHDLAVRAAVCHRVSRARRLRVRCQLPPARP